MPHSSGTRRSFVATCLSCLAIRRILQAQQPIPAPTFSTNVNVVNVFATVRDKKGQIIQDLTKDDFRLSEDGRPQTIRYFARQSDLPLTLGLLVDTSMSERRMLGTERQASYAFLEQVLRPDKDKAFLIHFEHDVELLQDLTSSRERLEKALEALDKPEWRQAGGPVNGNGTGGGYGRHRGGGGRGHGGTAFYDAVYLASGDLMEKQAGRKALIMLTDGEDNASKVSLQSAIESAQRADTLAYAIRIADEQGFGGGFPQPGMGRHGGRWGGGGPRGSGPAMNQPDGKKILQQISKETGGSYFEASQKKTLTQIYNQVEEELRNQYSLGYTSDRPATDAAYRKIQLTVDKKGLTVQTREGYYPGSNKPSS